MLKSQLANSVGMRTEALYRIPVLSIDCLHMNKVQLWFHSGDHSPLWAESWELTNLWNHFIPPKFHPLFLYRWMHGNTTVYTDIYYDNNEMINNRFISILTAVQGKFFRHWARLVFGLAWPISGPGSDSLDPRAWK